MGLGLTAFRNLTKVDALFDASGEPVNPATREPISDYFQPRVNSDFPGREGELEHQAIYTYEARERVFDRSYGGYNAWREALATLACYPEAPFTQYGRTTMRRDAAAWAGLCEEMPFVELVNFSDCEGVIGPLVAAKLAKDFAEWDERAKAFQTGCYDFYEAYSSIRRGLEIAACDGALKFS